MKLGILFILSLLTTILFSQDDPYLIKNIKTSVEVNALAFSPDGSKILAGFKDGSAEIINIESGKTEIKISEHWKGVMDVEWDPKGKYFMTAGDKTIKIWSPDGERIYNMRKHTTTIYTADIDPKGEFMVSGSISPAFKYWDVLKGEFIEDVIGHKQRTTVVCFSRDGEKIASGSSDHTIKIWNAGTREQIMELRGHQEDMFSLDFSPDGKLLASCSKDKTIRIYDLEKGELLKILTGHKNFVTDIEFAPDNLHLVSCSFDMEIRIWEIPTGKNMYSFIDHKKAVIDVCFAPDGKSFASASYDKSIKIWNYTTDIFVDYYFSDEVIEEMEDKEEFLPRQKGEKKADYRIREEKAEQIRLEIYAKYYQLYLEKLNQEIIQGMK